MDFNGRMSMARSVQPVASQNRRQPEEFDAFMIPDHEIATCISEIGIPFTVDDLRKPNAQHIQKLFEYFSFIIMNISRDVVTPAMRTAAEELVGPEADRLYSSDVRDLMGFFVMLRRLLAECSINDFAFSDLYRPTYPRLQKILSYIINFVRFRESQTTHIDKYFEEAERTKLRVQQLYSDKDALEQRLAQLQRDRSAVDRINRDKEEQLAELKPKLLELDRKKGRLVQDNARAEEEKKSLLKLMEERAAQLDAARDDAAKLRPYTLQKPDSLEAAVRELNGALAADKALMELLERRTRALHSSADAFATAVADVQACTRLLTDLAADMAKEEEEQSKAARHKEALSDRRNIVQDVERQEKLLQQQLDTINARTEKLRKTAEEKGAAASVKMTELKELHQTLQRERNDKAREIERRRVRIEQTEKKMADLKDVLENEIHAAREEYLKMESHINMYINEMEQAI